jgi:AAA15 family ATPase/GTPase
MIVSLSVSNFRSFDGEQTFSLVASNRLSGKHEGHTVPIPGSDSRVLRAGVLYGANGAGKSNLFKALRLLKAIATGTRKKNAPIRREAFRFGNGQDKPTVLDIQFVAGGRLYRYGVKVSDRIVSEEWLSWFTQGAEKMLYERATALTGEVKVELGGTLRQHDKFNYLARAGCPPNQSFLATAWSILGTLAIPWGIRLARVWFGKALRLISPGRYDRGFALRLVRKPDLRDFAGRYLRSSSTGIENLTLAPAALSEDEFNRLVSPYPGWQHDMPEGAIEDHALPDGDVARVERNDGFHYSRLSMRADHRTESGELASLNLAEESDGTRRLLQLIPALHSLRRGDRVYVIDEVDRSLHPMLVRNFLEYFLNSCEGRSRQLVMTTHESSLLDQDLLRRDEIWFAEKDSTGATSLYSLLDFKVRNDLEIRKHYLQGRFGAVPFLGGADRLMPDRDSAA